MEGKEPSKIELAKAASEDAMERVRQPDVPSYKPRKHGQTAPGDPENKLPRIEIRWDASAQEVYLRFDNTHFYKWDFVLAILGMATEVARLKKREQELMVSQQQAIQQMQEAAIAQELQQRGIIPGRG